LPVLFLAPEPLRPSLTGPARRTVKLAEAVAAHQPVTLAAPAPSVFPDGPFRTLETGPPDDQRLAAAFAAHDVSVVQTLPSPRQLLVALRHARRLVVDLIAPLALEAREMQPPGPARAAAVRWRMRELEAHLAAADLVLCTNEHQRDLLMGAALSRGLLEADRGRPALDERLAVVPHGIEGSAPRAGRSPLRTGMLGGDAVRVAVWGGGLWSWLDPLTAVRAVELLRGRRDDLKLAFVGLEHPDPEQRRAHEPVAAQVRAYVRDRGLEDAVVLRPRWLGREEYLDHLVDADVGVSLHGATLEGRYASRTRVVDYLEAGLPVVATRGDAMSALVERHRLGRVVQPGDPAGCADALDALTGPEAPSVAVAGALDPLRWPNVARPLVEFCADPPPPRAASRREALGIAARAYPAFVLALGAATGPRGVAHAATRSAGRLRRQRGEA
jgi:hypothetical protein